jgi:hypothetical protein
MPRTNEELATALMLTDHFMSPAELREVSEKAAGGPPQLPEHIREKLSAAEVAAAAEASSKMLGPAPRRRALAARLKRALEGVFGFRS